jgi:hypothetical protein
MTPEQATELLRLQAETVECIKTISNNLLWIFIPVVICTWITIVRYVRGE